MSEVTVNQLADTVGIPIERLLAQLHEAGITAPDGEARLTEQEKLQLLGYLRRSHGKVESDLGTAPNRVTLKRKSVSELRQPTTSGRAGGGIRAATAPRAKTISVEVRRKRTYVKRGVPEVSDEGTLGQSPSSQVVEESGAARTPVARRSELQARRAEEDARRFAEQEALERKAREEEALRQSQEEETRRRAADEARRKAATEGAAKPGAGSPGGPAEKPGREGAGAKPAKTKERKQGKQPSEKEKSIRKAGRKDSLRTRELPPEVEYEEAIKEEAPVMTERRPRRRKKTARPQLQDKHGFQRPTAPVVREVAIPEAISVVELASRMSVKSGDVIKVLFKQGVPVTINQVLDSDTAMIAVEDMGHKAVKAEIRDIEDTMMRQVVEQTERLEQTARPPVVTIMGHVDHGKTSLLDHIRRTHVANGEAGGITQHIGAYHVETGRGLISFLDTPGHAAFSAMRARGAQVTDIVVLVVAADDGVMPQTIESIQHARAAGAPLVVAVNKIDKAEANPDRVLQELAKQEVVPEEWGGETIVVKVSAKSGEGIDDLLEALLLQAEVLELAAPATGPARGVIVESRLDKGRGPVATVLVRAGTLRRGDLIVSGTEFGRVRAMFDEQGQEVKSAGPSIPVQVLGLSGTPDAGDDAVTVTDEKRAREIAELRRERERCSKLDEQRASLDQLFSQFREGETQAVNLVIKADVQGSLEALRDSLLKLSTDEVKVAIVASGVGELTESDANLAVTSNAILLGFNVRADTSARRIVEEKGLDLRYYSVIYELIDDVKKALSGLLSPEITESIVGLAQVRDVFRSSKFGAIAGCMVVEGLIKRNNPIRVLRDNVVIYEGALESLRRFKEDVPEVKSGAECGIGVKNYNDVQVGDQIEVFERTERAREL